MECGVVVEWIGEIIQKLSARIYLYAALPQVRIFVLLISVGNGLDRSDYLKVRYNPAEQSRLFPTLKKQNFTNISKFVQQINLSKQHALLQIRSVATLNSTFHIPHSKLI